MTRIDVKSVSKANASLHFGITSNYIPMKMVPLARLCQTVRMKSRDTIQI